METTNNLESLLITSRSIDKCVTQIGKFKEILSVWDCVSAKNYTAIDEAENQLADSQNLLIQLQEQFNKQLTLLNPFIITKKPSYV